uniref:Small ribosomal subunit protein uS9c n=1 Tax=Halimeda micronesica TaxID=170426 RepID=A0A386AXD8_9CHLO|nr:ribosomal protein S9 [Halimeda micronesica]
MKYYGVGRRKCAVAQVFIDSQSIDKAEIAELRQALVSQEVDRQLPNCVKIKVSGGGKTSQKEAKNLALARAFRQIEPTFNFKKLNLLTQDSRIKERKKYGLKKARKAPQYSKR